jgi:hypothetical protein
MSNTGYNGCINKGVRQMNTYRITKSDLKSGQYVGALDVANIDGHLELEAGLGTPFFISMNGIRVAGDIVALDGTGIRADAVHAGGSIRVGGKIETNFGIKAGGSIVAGGDLTAGYSIEAGGSIETGGGISANLWLKARDLVRARGRIYAGWGVVTA